MHARQITIIALAAGTTLACSSIAHADDPTLAPDAPIRARIGGYVYINARTGERTVSTSPSPTRDDSFPHFVNEDSSSNGYWFWGMDNPTQTFPTTVGGGQRIGGEAASWGDVAFDTRIDAFVFGYATYLLCAPVEPLENLDMTMWWYDCDAGDNSLEAVPVVGITIEDLNGGDCTFFTDAITGWIYTIDVAGTGLEFEIGDTDGSFTGITGASSTGCDKDDTDGSPKADFGWSYVFDQSETGIPLGIIGPFLVLPASADTHEDDHMPTGASGNADGVPDQFDFYKNPSGGLRELHAGTYNFGGWPAQPYSSFHLGLYGPTGPDCTPADFNADTIVDVLDFLDFIDDFGSCENQPAPCGSTADADLTGDTIVDILDFLRFFDLFGQCG
jgi:hypothetical protein